MSNRIQGTIGESHPRARARRLVAGKGHYTDDIVLPRMLFAAFVRSSYAHARIVDIDLSAARDFPGVRGIFTGRDVLSVCLPYQTVNRVFPEMKSPLQHCVAVEKVCYQGEPVAIVVADTRALAEDAAEAVYVEWEPLPAVANVEKACQENADIIHSELGTNLCFRSKIETSDVDRAFRDADFVVEESFVFGRHTGVPLEGRVIIASFDRADRSLTVWQSHQVPHELQGIYARQLELPENKVRVVCPDVGGAFGIKLQAYNDEIAICAATMILGRPIKFQADRLESFLSDVQARDHHVTARIAVSRAGEIQAFAVKDIFAIGPYPQFPRSSLQEGFHVIQLTGAPYRFSEFRGNLDVVFQNKVNAGLYRAVGQPVACAVTERLIDLAAHRLGQDPVEFRAANYLDESKLPLKSASNVLISKVAVRRCHDAVVKGMNVAALREEQRMLRQRSLYRGLGFATFMETVNPCPGYYTDAALRISTQDSCVLRLEPGGTLRCAVSLSEFGQGVDAAIAQVVAAGMGVSVDDVDVKCGDSANTPFGGGSWASRGIMMGSEVGWRAARALRENILRIAGQMLQASADTLDIQNGQILDADGNERISLAEIADVMHFHQAGLPLNSQTDLTVVSHYIPREHSYLASVGVQASYVEVDIETGFVRLLRHGVAHDCGMAINPLLVAEQLRGGIVQGIGSALFEECLYDEEGQLLNGTFADYLVPMAADVPDIDIFDVSSPWQPGTPPKPKGVGEAGAAGSSGAILNAINDAIRPTGATIAQLPCTPERILRAIQQAACAKGDGAANVAVEA